jgi:hypothetical protein
LNKRFQVSDTAKPEQSGDAKLRVHRSNCQGGLSSCRRTWRLMMIIREARLWSKTGLFIFAEGDASFG